jgi:hypothetical protein
MILWWKGFWEMILWKWIWLNDFMMQTDIGK